MMSEILARAAASLIHFAWQGALIAAGLAFARAATRDPRARYAAACVALGAMALAPIVTFFVSDPAPAIEHAPSVRGVSIAPLVVLAWAAGAAIMCARLAGAFVFVRRVLAKDAHLLDDTWQARVARIAARLGVTRVVRIAESARVAAPAVVGFVKPLILIPASALTDIPPQFLDALLAHEIAHIRRHDYLVNAVQSALTALLFYHPCVFWVSRCIREEREHCCDDEAVALTGDPFAYARALAAIASSRPEQSGLAPVGVSSNGGSLMNRIRRLLEPAPLARAPRLAVFIVAAASVLAAGALPMLACASSAGNESSNQGEQALAEGTPRAQAAPAIHIPWLPAKVARWSDELTEVARRYGVDPEMLAIMTMMESNGDPDAKSPSGALGLMQIMPATARKIADARGVAGFTVDKLYDPATNLDFGAWYVAEQLRAFGKDHIELAAAAYNGGPEAVRAFLAGRAPLSEETAHYKDRVATLWARRHDESR
jgi:soluble lytic murein transglycosylase-like protein